MYPSKESLKLYDEWFDKREPFRKVKIGTQVLIKNDELLEGDIILTEVVAIRYSENTTLFNIAMKEIGSFEVDLLQYIKNQKFYDQGTFYLYYHTSSKKFKREKVQVYFLL